MLVMTIMGVRTGTVPLTRPGQARPGQARPALQNMNNYEPAVRWERGRKGGRSWGYFLTGTCPKIQWETSRPSVSDPLPDKNISVGKKCQ